MLGPLLTLAVLQATPSVDLPPDVARAVRAYAWEGGARVPTPEGLAPGPVPFGEAGLVPDARLYARFEPEPKDLVAGIPIQVAAGAGEAVEGRFGGGLRLAAGKPPLEVRGRPGLLRPPFTISFWMRALEPATKGEPILVLPGVCSLHRSKQGHWDLMADDGEERLFRHEGPIREGAWTHVALAVDGPELDHAVRLSVDGEATGRRGPDGVVARLADLGTFKVGGLACEIDELAVTGRALTTAELIERGDPPRPAGPIRLALETADGPREIVAWAGVSTDPWLDDPAGFARVARDHLRIEEDGMTWAEGQWREHHPPVRPLARTTHPTVYVGEHRVLIYGGETRDSHTYPWRNTDDTWIYEVDTETWRRVAAGGPAPSPRCHQPAAWSPDHGLVFYAGGWRNDRIGETTFREIWVYHVADERWEERQPAGAPMGAISNSIVLYHPKFRRFLLIHGQSVRSYDPEKDAWGKPLAPTVVDLRGEPVDYTPGSSAMAGYDPETGWIVIFGGARDEIALDYQDLTVHYDVEGGRIEVQEPSEHPTPRVRAGFAYDGARKRFVLYGGVKDQFSQRMDDLWSYVPATSTWTRLSQTEGPGRRGGLYDMAYDPELDRFVLLCGRSAPDRFHNDAWTLALDPKAPATAEAVFDRTQAAGRTRFAVRVQGGGEVRARFAWSDDALEWTEWLDSPDALPAARFLRARVEIARGAGDPPRLRALGLTAAADAGLHQWPLAP